MFVGLIKKMIQYAQKELLASLCCAQNENLGTLLVEVVASVLDNEVCVGGNSLNGFTVHNRN